MLDNTYDYSNRNSILIDEGRISPIKTSLLEEKEEEINSSEFQEGKKVAKKNINIRDDVVEQSRGKENAPSKTTAKNLKKTEVNESTLEKFPKIAPVEKFKDKQINDDFSIPQEEIEEHVR